MPPKRPHQTAQVHAGTQAMSEAETLQQRGERRKGQEALPFFQQAAEKYRLALARGLPNVEVCMEARFGIGWCLALGAEAVMTAASSLPDEHISWESDRQARAAACDLCLQAATAYEQVRDSAGLIRADAAVNAGNALCSLAELLVSPDGCSSSSSSSSTVSQDAVIAERACQTFEKARQMYALAQRAAEAEAAEEDPEVWSNLADCLVAYAQLLAEGPLPGRRGEAEEMCRAALQAYERSCALSDSAHGDDLPGLLCNWGSGLLAVAQMTQPAQVPLLVDAASHLQHSADFSRADTEPLVKLGDVLAALAELAQGEGHVQAAARLYSRALEEGYRRALAINRMDSEALEGVADTHAEVARLLSSIGDTADAEQHWTTSLNAYTTVLQNPNKVNGFRERCEVRFNFACALVRCGREEMARDMIMQLNAVRGVTVSDLETDADFEKVRDKPWFQQLLAEAQGSHGM